MLFFFVYLVVRRLARLVAGGSAAARLEVENAVLRDQLSVLRRTVKRPELRRRDRVVLAAASGLLPRERWSLFVFSRQTLSPYLAQYNGERPHRALELAAPAGQPPLARGSPPAAIRRRDVLDGLIHEYHATAA